jgi:ABC-type bacteriocin/lantibiotic exporter with double-glycine peptidase domain
MQDVMMALVVTSMVVSLFWIVFSTVRRVMIARKQAELNAKLMEKFSSGHDLTEFANSEAGKRFLESALIEQQKANPYARILNSVQVGILLALAGIACFLIGRQVPDAAQGFTAFGTLSVTMGVGFLVSAAASYRLSKSFGLFEPLPDRRT